MLAVGRRDGDDVVVADLDFDLIREVRNTCSSSGTAGPRPTGAIVHP